MRTPHQKWFVLRIIVSVIVLRDINRQTFAHIPFVLSIQGNTVIFRMSHHKNPATTLCHCQKQPRLFRFCKNRDFFTFTNIFDRYFSMSGMRCQKHIIKSTYKGDLAVQNLVPEKPEHFVIQLFFLKSVEMIQAGLCCPAKKNGRSHMTSCPVHNLFQFFPVIHFFKFHLLYRGTCNDHSVETLILKFRKCLIKFIQMAYRSILCFMTLHRHKSNIYLQRCVGQ